MMAGRQERQIMAEKRVAVDGWTTGEEVDDWMTGAEVDG